VAAQLWQAIGWRRLAVTGLCLVAWRALEQITVVGANPGLIAARLQAEDTSSLVHSIGSGIPLAGYSIVALGLTPYINALIIVTLAIVISKRVRAIANSPEGRRRTRRWVRALAVFLALGQAYGWTVLMQSGSLALLPPMDWSARLVICVELAAGTMILVLLGDVLDEFGLGFGNGAILIFALSPLALEVHRLVDIVALAPSVEALYLPLAIWAGFSIGLAAATVAVLLAVRPVVSKGERPSKRVELKVLMSGVLRPPLFASAVLFVPVIIANYYSAANPDFNRWIYEHATAYGPNPWTDIAYAAVDAGLVMAFTYFVVLSDFGRVPRNLAPYYNRLTFIGGAFLALSVVVVPIAEYHATNAAGQVIALSGRDALLVVAIITAAIGSLERIAKSGRGLLVQVSRLP
jgi:preprotein translocase subunit SecY